MRKYLVLSTLLLVALSSFGEETGEPSGTCKYVVRDGDNLSRILVKLGILPIWGKSGSVKTVVKENKNIQKEGDLIFPQMRLSIPRHLVRNDEVCIDGNEETDIGRRIALYSEAEAEMGRLKYSSLCRKVVGLAQTQERKENQGKLLHLAAICEYEEGKLERAHELWEEVLGLEPEPSLRYRANYNLALIECQGDNAREGYDRLRAITSDLWQSQGPYERRTFLDLGAYCAERGVGAAAKLETLMGVYKTAPAPELRAYAEEKLRSEFSNPAQCEHNETTLASMKDDPNYETWDQLWRENCKKRGFISLITASVNPAYLQFSNVNQSPSWAGVGGTVEAFAYWRSGWSLSASIDTLIQPLVKTGTTSDVRTVHFSGSAGYVEQLSLSDFVEVAFQVGYVSFLTEDHLLGFYDLMLYGLRLSLLDKDFDRSWYRLTLFAGITNSDTQAFAFNNGIASVTFDVSPAFFNPGFVGLRGEYGSVSLAGVSNNLFQGAVRIGVAW